MLLVTEKYQLRSLTSSDLNSDYYLWWKDPEVTRYLNIHLVNLSEQDIKHYVDSHDNHHSYFFGIFDQLGQFIGTHSFKLSATTNRAAIGGMIGRKEFWGKNVILETRSAILEYAFNNKNCIKVEAGCYKNNYSAVYNFLRQGWIKEGVLRAHRTIDGVSEDLILFGMLKDEWNAHN